MKSIFTLFLGFILPAIGFAQDFVYTPEQHIVAEIQDQSYESFEIKIATPQLEGITYKWEVVNNTLPLGVYPDIDGWAISVCDYTSCYTSIPEDEQSMTALGVGDIVNGAYAFLKLNVMTMDFVGEGICEVYVYDSEDYSRGDTISFSLSNMNTAVVEHDLSQLNVYPNPVSTMLYVDADLRSSQWIELRDITGRLADRSFIQSGRNSMNVDALNPGIYFLRFEDGEETKRIVVQ